MSCTFVFSSASEVSVKATIHGEERFHKKHFNNNLPGYTMTGFPLTMVVLPLKMALPS